MLSSTDLAILREYQARQQTKASFAAWCRSCGFEPAAHHLLVISLLEQLTRGYFDRLMILMPPGAAKSTYTSKCFPPWYLAQKSGLTILACSHSGDLATSFGRVARNYAEGNERWLGYRLNKESRAADEWATSNGGQYYCAGVGAGISGRRADLVLIDDFLGKEEDVNSDLVNDKIFDWYVNDVVPRLKPHAKRVIIANHRSKKDLVGRLLATEAAKWRIIKLRLVIENEAQAEEDPLHRTVGQHLWPEYFTAEMVSERIANPHASGIEQQDPTALQGNHFKREMLLEYQPSEFPVGVPLYGASDHAVRTKQRNDETCMGLGALRDGILYVHEDLMWDRIPTNKAVAGMMRFNKTYRPIYWWAEKENISGSIGPFLDDAMREAQVWMSVTEVPTRGKDLFARSQAIHALMSNGRVRFPAWTPWWKRAKAQLLDFPNGDHDDFVSFVSHLGMGIAAMIPNKSAAPPAAPFNVNQPFVPTLKWLKESEQRKQRLHIARLRADE